jgi:ribosomal protein S18 acetylase RimI-like enzyme
MLAIRDMRAEDALPMEELLVAAWQSAYSGVVDPAFAATRRDNDYAAKFRSMLDSGEYRLRVAEIDGRVAGLATGASLGWKSYDCETKGLYVHPECQGRGVGSALLRDMMEHFRQRGCRSMIIWTFLGVRNNGFYRAMGGTISEEEDREYGGKIYRMAGFAFRLSEKGVAGDENPA